MMKWGQFWRTIRYLRFIQIFGRIWFWVYTPRRIKRTPLELRKITGQWHLPANRTPSLIGSGQFNFLNEKGCLISNGWDDPKKSKLWRYNQHYFDDLNAFDAFSRRHIHEKLISEWLKGNVPFKGTGWEPYPTSLRIVNWIKWSFAGNNLSGDARDSLALQARWLRKRLEWHLLGNHLFANAKALIYAGFFFEGSESNSWLNTGLSILKEQIPEQILSDGGHFELSPMYHALALEDMLDLVNIAEAFGRIDLAKRWREVIPPMISWLQTMSHPDGRISFFNDSTFGFAPENAELFEYASRVGILPTVLPKLPKFLAVSGYARLESGKAIIVADIAKVGPDYLPAHSHADTLSFEMSLDGRRIIVNSGISEYGIGPERLRERGTSAHSTLSINGQNSSEIWSGFRVGRRAVPVDVSITNDHDTFLVSAGHTGYRYLTGAPTHYRTWFLDQENLKVVDKVLGRGHVNIQSWLHLGEGLKAKLLRPGKIEIFDERKIRIATITFKGSEVRIIKSSWNPEFGIRLGTEAIYISTKKSLPHSLQFIIQWE